MPGEFLSKMKKVKSNPEVLDPPECNGDPDARPHCWVGVPPQHTVLLSTNHICSNA
jgi:hypothetical protein